MAATLHDIARAAGVGQTTVLRALRDQGDISPDTKARIKKIAAEMKYRPNQMARYLVTGHSTLVGVMAVASAFHATFGTIERIENDLQDCGYSMVLSNAGARPGGERKSLEEFMANRVAGVIAVPASQGTDLGAYQELLESGIKIVVADRYVEGLQVPQTVGDDYALARIATEHLISLGHTDIAYLAIPEDCYAGRERARGFRDATRNAGIEVAPSSLITTGLEDRHGMAAMQQLLERKERPTAIVTRHDTVAAGAMRAIFAAGLSIPEDISLVGNGNVWCSDILRVPLTTIRHPMEEMASKSVAKLLAMLSGEHVEPVAEAMKPELVIRMSTAPPRSI